MKPIPALSVRDLTGLEHQLGTTKKEFQFVLFTAADCGQCKESHPFLGALADRESEHMETIMICKGDERSVRAFAQGLPGHIAVIADRKWHLGNRFQVHTLPFAFLTDSHGIVRAKSMPLKETSFEWFSAHIPKIREQMNMTQLVSLNER